MKNVIEDIKQHLKKDSYSNEEAVRSQICYRILQELGWKTSSPVQVVPEYSINNLRVDIALCSSPNKPVIFIEVKAPGQCSEQGVDQIFDYAARKGGVPMIILSDGNEWRFYNTHGTGIGYEARKVRSFKLTEDSSDECVKVFDRYLQFEKVKSKIAFENLRDDHKKIEDEREAKLKIPEAWKQLINDEDEILIEVIVDQVKESSDGEYAPKKEDVVEFLKRLEPTAQPPIPPLGPAPTPPELRPGGTKVKYRYKINGVVHTSRTGKHVYMEVLDHVLFQYGWSKELKNSKWNKLKSRGEYGRGFHLSEHADEIPKKMEQKTQLPRSRVWVNKNMSAENMSTKLADLGSFYAQAKGRKILGKWGTGAEVEFDIPTRPT